MSICAPTTGVTVPSACFIVTLPFTWVDCAEAATAAAATRSAAQSVRSKGLERMVGGLLLLMIADASEGERRPRLGCERAPVGCQLVPGLQLLGAILAAKPGVLRASRRKESGLQRPPRGRPAGVARTSRRCRTRALPRGSTTT